MTWTFDASSGLKGCSNHADGNDGMLREANLIIVTGDEIKAWAPRVSYVSPGLETGRRHSSPSSWARKRGTRIFVLCLGLFIAPAMAQNKSPELVQPPICSAATAGYGALREICTVATLGSGHNEVKIDLTAQTAQIEIGGYKVTTDNYNASYLTPVVEAMPGDRVAARLSNILQRREHHGMTHGDANENPTNLHYFHGGIVSPNNARPKLAELGDGDNIYVHLKAGRNAGGDPNSFEYTVPIPGEGTLDARVLEGTGYIAHPVGLNWYHSHMHGISSDQVMGGMSGLLSVGEATANVKAACRADPNDRTKCSNDVVRDTADLRAMTEVRYALLRDIPLRNIGSLPEEANGASAEWDPPGRDFPQGTPCGVWKKDDSGLDLNPKLRAGFCQRDRNSAWLFTINGQRFPTITVEGGRNLLIRLADVSANIGYWLELYNEVDGTVLPLTVLGLDGVVPARPVPADQAQKPVEAINYNDLLLMPASRAEIFIRNDEKPHPTSQAYILRTKGLRGIGSDEWPEIQLARIVLKPNVVASSVAISLNVPVGHVRPEFATTLAVETPVLPEGCIRDLNAAFKEFRRITFLDGDQKDHWSLTTEIVRPDGTDLREEGGFTAENSGELPLGPIAFEEYLGPDGLVDWKKRHVCIQINRGTHTNSHKQLWVLFNATDTLHNFHIHQMKFRLATRQELEERHIDSAQTPSRTCPLPNTCAQPDYRLYDEAAPTGSNAEPLWHDTIPIPPFSKVFLVMSFDAKEQIGRFVFHCHILKHEDKGLMAPIEVWEPDTGSVLQ